jgi:hypothetical protein
MNINYTQKMLLLKSLKRKSDITKQILACIENDYPNLKDGAEKFVNELKDLEHLKNEVLKIDVSKEV